MENLLLLLPRRPQSVPTRYLITTAIVILCFLLRWGLETRAGIYGFYLMFPGVFLASILFDRGSGFYAVGLSAALIMLTLEPNGSLLVADIHVLPIALFIAIALGLSAISEALRGALERAVAAEQTKALLLQELNHRTKNNLMIVMSVLRLQARSAAGEIRRALENAIGRINVMARAHDHLQRSTETGQVDMREYLHELGRHLGDSLRGIRPVAVRVESDSILLGAGRAVSIGLIVNELVTNSFKYAFAEQDAGTVLIALRRIDGRLRLSVADSGRGSAADMQRGSGHEGLGTRLTRLLVQQLDATLDYEDAAPGLRVVIAFANGEAGP